MVSWSRDAALARSCILRPPAVGTDRGRLRRLRRGGLPALLRGQDGGAFGATRALLPYAAWWATSRVSTLSVGWSGAARIPCRYGSSCCWRCGNEVPDHSWLSLGPSRAPAVHEVHTAVFALGPGADRRGGSGRSRRAHRAWMPIDHGGQRGAAQHRAEGHKARVTGGCWSAWPRKAGIETPTAEDLARLDRKRKGKKLSNQDWVSRSVGSRPRSPR